MEKRLKISKGKSEVVIQWPKENGQKANKQWSTKYYTENQRPSNTNPTKNLRWTQVLRKSKQFMFY